MWFGQFIHGVLEESYRRYNAAFSDGSPSLFPWSNDVITDICNLIKHRLSAQGLVPWDETLENLGDARAAVAINDLGPELFPLIHRAEVRLTGARPLPINQIPPEFRFREADRYEMVGVIDVITHVEINDPSVHNNLVVQAILQALPCDPPDHFEIIIDYKGMRRPPINPDNGVEGPSLWDIYNWQVQTYAHLRSTHLDSLPILAGVIIYLNELLPTKSDLQTIQRETNNHLTDVPALAEFNIPQLIHQWQEESLTPILSLNYRLQRALRVIPVTPLSIQESLNQFDHVVAQIETCRGREINQGHILTTWEANSSDEDTCTRCDARTYCPSYTNENQPRLPGVRAH